MLQYKVKMQGVGAVTKPIVATIITPCIFACITPYDSQAIARYMSWKSQQKLKEVIEYELCNYKKHKIQKRKFKGYI